jgi:hypothetical protein
MESTPPAFVIADCGNNEKVGVPVKPEAPVTSGPPKASLGYAEEKKLYVAPVLALPVVVVMLIELNRLPVTL